MLALRVLAAQPMHGYAIAQRISVLSAGELSVEEGSLYPALQKLLLKGWVKATPAGRKQLALEQDTFHRTTQAIVTVLETA